MSLKLDRHSLKSAKRGDRLYVN